MSISTPQSGGGKSRPAAGAKPAATGKPATKSTGKPAADSKPAADTKPAVRTRPKPGTRPTGSPAFGTAGTGGKGVAPVKVKKATNWGPILLFGTVGLIAVLIVAFASYQVYLHGLGWQDKAKRINGIQVYDRSKLARGHEWGKLTYQQSPPVGGVHNFNWQRCLGDVYDAPIANEHAVHSLEHGAVWITYRPDLPQAQIDTLKSKVEGNDFMLMSPYPGLDKPISLQAWGYQLKVDSASDKRIDEFIKDLKQFAGPEQASCSSGSYITATGTAPIDLGSPAPSASASAGASGSVAPSTPAPSASS